ncbi:MAG: tRNA pseudouridine(38-40) synthase TruA [Bacteroidetes bacterium]|nr:tRNA pseudouridine(38-40) synthase TruA [Bacteroidota bacterium]
MPRYRMCVEYDGSEFHGWQRQPNGDTVQSALEHGLSIAARQPVAVTGAGRTDAGVHARGQVAHFDLNEVVDEHALLNSVNALTPWSVAVRSLQRTSDTFHARFDATGRRYGYRVSQVPVALDRKSRVVVPERVDFDRMNRAARGLIGTRNFESFCLTQSETTNRVCTISEAEWHAESREGDHTFRILADRFLHGMVRAIVGTLLEIGLEKRSESDLERIIAAQDRREAGPAAAAHGLILEEVYYANE